MHAPSLEEIRATREKIDPYIVETPVWHWRNQHISEVVGSETEVFLKLELLQNTGTFKPRGAINVMLNLKEEALSKGVTAVSAGNHAIAVGYAAQILGTSAKVVMPKSSNPGRVASCKAYGVEVVFVDDVVEAFDAVYSIEEEENRTFIHPFEGPFTTAGTATVGYEFCSQVPEMDAIIVSIGGGGLISGVATAVKNLQPDCQVYGVEPEGADTMHRSFASGKPEKIDKVQTIADSLGSPNAAPYSFTICQQYVDELVMVNDNQLRQAMLRMSEGMKLVVEPAGVAALAALCGPLREGLHGKRVGVLICGSNIDPATFAAHIADITP
jgi:threonine dehydratase